MIRFGILRVNGNSCKLAVLDVGLFIMRTNTNNLMKNLFRIRILCHSGMSSHVHLHLSISIKILAVLHHMYIIFLHALFKTLLIYNSIYQ